MMMMLMMIIDYDGVHDEVSIIENKSTKPLQDPMWKLKAEVF